FAQEEGTDREVRLIPGEVLFVLMVIVAGFLAPLALFFFTHEREFLETVGQVYGAALQLQLAIDLIVVTFWLMLKLWPSGAAVALPSFGEGVRQPMFWLLFGLAITLMTLSPFVPYFTFGEDHIMLKELGFDTIMLFAVVFAALAAAMSISEEIEGRTA